MSVDSKSICNAALMKRGLLIIDYCNEMPLGQWPKIALGAYFVDRDLNGSSVYQLVILYL